MRYLLDTNICIFLINRNPEQVRKRIQRESVGQVAVSPITISELSYGVEKSRGRAQNKVALQKFLMPLAIVVYDEKAAEQYGRLRAFLEREGKSIGPMDMLIAAHALALGLTLVTNNTGEFQRVPRLHIEDWSKPAGES